MKEIDAEKELSRILQEEIAKIWDETPLGYNETNNAYHMGRGMMVTKEGWDKYQEALKSNPDLGPQDYLVEELKKLSKENNGR